MSPRLSWTIGSLLVMSGMYEIVVRPWVLNWGATQSEISMVLPGDDIVPNTSVSQTRAITVQSRPEEIWPWIAQIGQDRAGFYTFDLLENIIGCQMPVTDTLSINKQEWRLGDPLWLYPANRWDGLGYASLRTFEPNHAIGFGTSTNRTNANKDEDGSWTFVLQPIDASSTRLIVRGKGPIVQTPGNLFLDRVLLEPMHFAMEQRMMIGIKQLSEGGVRDRVANHVAVIYWLVVAIIGMMSLVSILRDNQWIRSLCCLVASAIVFQILTLVQPQNLISTLLVVGLCILGWHPSRVKRPQRSKPIPVSPSHA